MRYLLILAFALALGPASAAQLDTGQMTTLRSACAADAPCNAAMSAADDIAIAAWFNAADPGGCVVWRHDVTIAEANGAMVWTEIDALTNGKARIWDWMRQLGVLDTRQSNIRQGINDAFSAANSTRAALTALAKRVATRAEKALATGACTSANPSIMTFVGAVSYADASLIRSL